MKTPIFSLIMLGCGTLGAMAGTIYDYIGADNVDMDWDNLANYNPNTGIPNAPGDTLRVAGANQANAYKMNGNRTIGSFSKTVQLGQSTNITAGSVVGSVLTWDTGVPGTDAILQVFGSGGDANRGDLRCATLVNMYLKSNLQWKGSSTRDNAANNGRLSGDISGPGKLTVSWNSTKAKTGNIGNHMLITGGLGVNTHVGGTEFSFFNKSLNNGAANPGRGGYLLAKEQATGMGNTTVNGNAEIYIDTNLGTQGAIHDTTSVKLLTGATVELASGVNEKVSGLYFDGVLQAAGTWGSGLSAADNKNDTWFKGTGTGVLNVVYAQEIAVEQPVGTQLIDGPTTIAYGNTGIAMPIVKTFTVTNIGTATLTLTDVIKDGTDSADFIVGVLGSLSLAPAASTTFDVTFNPLTLGAKTAAIHITNDDGDEASFDINLSGTGVIPAYNWAGPNNGLWSTPGNWNNMMPGAGKVAVFSDTGAGATVDIDAPSATAGGLTFNNNVANTLIKSTSASPLILDNSTAVAPITVSGSHTISANFQAAYGIAVTGGGSATLSGTATAVGASAGGNAVVMDVYGTGTELVLGGSVTLAASRDTHVMNNGKMTITGTYVTSGHDQIIGSTDHGGGTGDVVLSGTGSWTHSGGGVFVVGNEGVGNVGTITINDSAVLDLSGNMPLFIAVGWGGGSAGAIVQNGGLVKPIQVAQAWRTSYGPGVMIGQWNNNACSATYSLNGGILQTPSIGNIAWDNALNVVAPPSTYGATAILNLNGGVIKASDSDLTDPDAVAEGTAHLIFNLSHAWVQERGAKIDTDGHNNSVNVKLEHDSSGPAIDGGLTKQGLGTLTLLQDSTYTGPTKVQAGTLACTTIASLAPTALEIDASLTAIVALDYTGNQTIPSLKIGESTMPDGIYGSSTSGASSPNDHFTGTGTVTVGTGTPPTPYSLWISPTYFPVGDPRAAKDQDPDGDGQNNLMEFALDGTPNNGALNAKVFSYTGVVPDTYSGQKVLILTIAVRIGTTFTSATADNVTDGIRYTVEGGTNLSGWIGSVFPFVDAASYVALPALDPAKYKYQSFALDSSMGLPGKGFLRVRVEPLGP